MRSVTKSPRKMVMKMGDIEKVVEDYLTDIAFNIHNKATNFKGGYPDLQTLAVSQGILDTLAAKENQRTTHWHWFYNKVEVLEPAQLEKEDCKCALDKDHTDAPPRTLLKTRR